MAASKCADVGWWLLPYLVRALRERGPLMPEPPDFDKIAQVIVDLVSPRMEREPNIRARLIVEVSAVLRQQWNARGAADAKAVEDRLATLTGWVTSEPYRQHLREAITGLDR